MPQTGSIREEWHLPKARCLFAVFRLSIQAHEHYIQTRKTEQDHPRQGSGL